MANEIRAHYASGSTLYACVRNSTGQVWYPVGSVFETWGTGARTAADYAISLTDKTGSLYLGTFPACAAGVYDIQVFEQAGGSPANTDYECYHQASFGWNGSQGHTVCKLSSEGLDDIDVTQPTGVATTFREMIVSMWLRLYAKVTLSSTELKVHNTSNVLVTTQVMSDDGTTQTMYKAQ